MSKSIDSHGKIDQCRFDDGTDVAKPSDYHWQPERIAVPWQFIDFARIGQVGANLSCKVYSAQRWVWA
ncbi:MAG TPA: hypothetical protein PL064_14600 [Thermogutta sp.]|nr:hypothetical protein [Thermogutta sp.]